MSEVSGDGSQPYMPDGQELLTVPGLLDRAISRRMFLGGIVAISALGAASPVLLDMTSSAPEQRLQRFENVEPIPSFPQVKGTMWSVVAPVFTQQEFDNGEIPPYDTISTAVMMTQIFLHNASHGILDPRVFIMPQSIVPEIDSGNNKQIAEIGDAAIRSAYGARHFDKTIYFTASSSLSTSSAVEGGNEAWISASANDLVGEEIAFEHELGHILGHGLSHSHAIENVVPNNYSVKLAKIEYGDQLDVMGKGLGRYNICKLLTLGWLEPAQIQTVIRPGVYWIQTTDQYKSDGIMGLRVKKPDTGDYYYIELRQNPTTGKMTYCLYLWDQGIHGDSYAIYPDVYTKKADGTIDRSFSPHFASGTVIHDDVNGITFRPRDIKGATGAFEIAF